MRGERFPQEGMPPPDEPYREHRAVVEVGAGEAKEVRIRCDFEPDRVLLDPDAKVLQLGRKRAVFRF